jgi:hypothetical protein
MTEAGNGKKRCREPELSPINAILTYYSYAVLILVSMSGLEKILACN